MDSEFESRRITRSMASTAPAHADVDTGSVNADPADVDTDNSLVHGDDIDVVELKTNELIFVSPEGIVDYRQFDQSNIEHSNLLFLQLESVYFRKVDADVEGISTLQARLRQEFITERFQRKWKEVLDVLDSRRGKVSHNSSHDGK